jgi:hypothetical protein
MTEHLQLIEKKLDHLQRMLAYLAYSLEQAQRLIPIDDWESLAPEDHETLAAFRVRFCSRDCRKVCSKAKPWPCSVC